MIKLPLNIPEDIVDFIKDLTEKQGLTPGALVALMVVTSDSSSWKNPNRYKFSESIGDYALFFTEEQFVDITRTMKEQGEKRSLSQFIWLCIANCYIEAKRVKARRRIKQEALEAIANRGKLEFKCDPETIKVIYEIAGKRKMHVADLLRSWIAEKIEEGKGT